MLVSIVGLAVNSYDSVLQDKGSTAMAVGHHNPCSLTPGCLCQLHVVTDASHASTSYSSSAYTWL